MSVKHLLRERTGEIEGVSVRTFWLYEIQDGVPVRELHMDVEITETFRAMHTLEDGEYVAEHLCLLQVLSAVRERVRAAIERRSEPRINAELEQAFEQAVKEIGQLRER